MPKRTDIEHILDHWIRPIIIAKPVNLITVVPKLAKPAEEATGFAGKQ